MPDESRQSLPDHLDTRDPCDGCDGTCGDVCPVLEAQRLAYARIRPTPAVDRCVPHGFPQVAIDAMITAAGTLEHDDGHADCYYAGLLTAAWPHVNDALTELRAENERLRKALAPLVEGVEGETWPRWLGHLPWDVREVYKRAIVSGRAALASDEQEATGGA